MKMTRPLDRNGQPSPAFGWKRNVKKELQTLFGICQGLVADQRLNELELLALDVWLKDNGHIHNDPDVVDLREQIRDILADGVVTAEELDDMRELIATIVEYRSCEASGSVDAVNQLIGIAHGLTADRSLNDAEIGFLTDWIAGATELGDEFPCNIIRKRVEAVVADGVINSAERAYLIDALEGVIGGSLTETGAYGLASKLALDDVSDLTHLGKAFCFTGAFIWGTRQQCQLEIAARGGMVATGVSKKVDYLVVGELASRDWLHETLGLKIKKAIALRDAGAKIQIIPEQCWVRCL